MMNDSEDALAKDSDQQDSLLEADPTNYDGEPNQHNYHREDDRWFHKRSWRDWWILLLLILTYLVWTGVIYFLEPGIR